MAESPDESSLGRPPLVQVAPVVRAGAGNLLPVEVRLTNTASASRALTVAALGLDPGWLQPPATTPLLAPGESAVVTLTLHPVTGTLPASYPFAVTAQAVDPAGRATGSPGVAESVLVVNPRASITLRMTRPHVTAILSARVGVVLHNSGGAPARVRLAAQCGQGVRLRLPDRDVEVPVGGETRVNARVRVVRPRLVRHPAEHQFRVSAVGAESAPYADGSVTVRGLIAPVWLKMAALLAIVSVWVAAAFVVIPAVGRHFGSNDTVATIADGSGESGDASGDGGSGGGQAGGTGGGQAGGKAGGRAGGKGGGKGGKGGKGGTKAAAHKNPAVQLNGTVAAEDPRGVQVSLAPTSLIDEEAIGGIGVGVDRVALTAVGKRAMTMALINEPGRTPARRGAVTGADGAWSFPSVTAPGYYLLTFSKPGYQTKKYVVDSSSAAAKKPLEVSLAPGEGSLSGRITGPGGPVGGAKVVISDGTSSVTASSNTKGNVGAWSVTGLSTPATYVVQASADGLSMEAAAVDLGAGGHAGVDLRLRNGVATLTGLVKAPTSTGEVVGAGGVTVTVTGPDDLVRSATTLTRSGQLGHYIVPALPAPGEYVVSIEGDGYLTRTSRLTLKKDQARATLDATLASATGVVHGTVRDAGTGNGLTDVGVVLSDAEHTYKTMTTSEQPGVFRINGVAAGTYTLTTRLFGYDSDQLTVTVGAGEDVRVNPTLASVTGGVLPASSSIVGAATDGTTQRPVTCPDAQPRCLHAHVEDPATGDGRAGATPYDTDFGPSETYTLPEGTSEGLRPGLHTVAISAPGYERTTVSVEVPADTKVTAPTAQLLPAPRFRGTVLTSYATSGGPTCLWAVQDGYTGALPTCTSAVSSHVCHEKDATYDGSVLTPQAICAYVGPSGGAYDITVPVHGSYSFRVAPADAEFYGPPDTTYSLASGQVYPLDVRLIRYGVLQVRVQKPGSGGTLVPAVGATVSVKAKDPAGTAPTPTNPLADRQGLVEIHGFSAGSYLVTATDADDPTITNEIEVYVGENAVTGTTISLTNPIGSIVGRVRWAKNGVATPVPGATVTGVFPAYYLWDSFPIPMSMTALTQRGGCFGIASSSVPAPSTTLCGADGLTGSALATGPVLSPTASTIEVSAPGFETWARNGYTFKTWQATDDATLNDITLTPLPVTFAASMTATPSIDDWSTVSFVVSTANANSNRFSMKALAGGVLQFTDATIGTLDQILPGEYTVTPSAPGFEATAGTLECTPNGSCSWVDGKAPELSALGAIHGTLVGVIAASPATTPTDDLAGVTVHAQRCSNADCSARTGTDYTGVTAGDGSFLITGTGGTKALKPGDYKLDATVTGFKSGGESWIVTVGSGSDADAGTLHLWIKPATLTVTLQDDNLAAVTGPTLDLLSGSTIVATGTVTGSTYVFGDVIPGNYTLQAHGSALRTQTMQVSVVRAVDNQSVIMPITLGAVATGQVTTQDGGVVPVPDVQVTLRTSTDCATGAIAKSSGGQDLLVKTLANGRYTIRNVPDGTYTVCFVAAGYITGSATPVSFDHLAAPIQTVDVTLLPVTHTVTLTVTPSDPDDPLDGAALKLTKGSVVLTATSWSKSGTTWVATFLQVSTGCWTPSLTLAAHYGSLGGLAADGTCTAGQVRVAKADTSSTVAASATLKEGSVIITAGTTFAPPHTALPTGAVVEVDLTAGTVSYTGPATTLWLPIGASWSVTASVTPASVFWPTSDPDTGTVTAAGKTATPTLVEKTKPVTVRVPTAGADVAVTATDLDGGTVTGTTAANGRVTLNLPEGTWDITATVTTTDTSTDPPTDVTTDYATEDYGVATLAADTVTLEKVS